MRGKREEVDLLAVRMTAAAYRGRMKEAAVLHDEWLARDGRRQPASANRSGHLRAGDQRSVASALADQAKARMAAALDEELPVAGHG